MMSWKPSIGNDELEAVVIVCMGYNLEMSGETTENHGDLESRRRYWNVGSPEYAAYVLDKYVRFLSP
jgi:hypothetical protein